VLLGAYDSAESHERYRALTAAWVKNSGQLPSYSQVTILHLIKAFWKHAQAYYVHADGTPTSEPKNLRYALRPLKKLFGRLPVSEFGPLKLKLVRDEMIKIGWARTYINRQVRRIKLMFKWGTENELVAETIFNALDAVAGLKMNRSAAHETKPVVKVPEHLVAAVRPFVSRQVWAMVELQWTAGMRPGEACSMRGCDIDMSEKQWIYKPAQHKNKYRGQDLEYYLDTVHQEIIKPLRPHQSTRRVGLARIAHDVRRHS
jgi:integrase